MKKDFKNDMVEDLNNEGKKDGMKMNKEKSKISLN